MHPVGRPGGIGDLTRKGETSLGGERIGNRYRRQESLGVGMFGAREKLAGFSRLYEPAHVHHGHTVAYVLHDAQIMSNKTGSSDETAAEGPSGD